MNLKGEPAFVGRHCGSNEYVIDEKTVTEKVNPTLVPRKAPRQRKAAS